MRVGFGLRNKIRVKAEQHVGDPLRIGGGAEDFALVVFERFDPTSDVLLIRLFQQAPTGSMNECLGRDFPRACGSFNRSLLPKKPANSIGPPAAGRMASCVRDAGIGVPMNWQTSDDGSVLAAGHQASLTAGTILHNAKTLLTVWFWAAYLNDHRQARALCSASAAPARSVTLRDVVDDAA